MDSNLGPEDPCRALFGGGHARPLLHSQSRPCASQESVVGSVWAETGALWISHGKRPLWRCPGFGCARWSPAQGVLPESFPWTHWSCRREGDLMHFECAFSSRPLHLATLCQSLLPSSLQALLEVVFPLAVTSQEGVVQQLRVVKRVAVSPGTRAPLLCQDGSAAPSGGECVGGISVAK